MRRRVPSLFDFKVGRGVRVPMDRDFDGSGSEAVVMVVSGVKDKVDRDEVHVVEGSLVQSSGLVVAALEAIDMGRNKSVPRHGSLVQTCLVQLESLEGCIGILWRWVDLALVPLCTASRGLAREVAAVVGGLLVMSTQALKP